MHIDKLILTSVKYSRGRNGKWCSVSCTYLGSDDVHENGEIGEMVAATRGVCGVRPRHSTALTRPPACQGAGKHNTTCSNKALLNPLLIQFIAYLCKFVRSLEVNC